MTTVKEISNYFDQLAKKVKSGDQVEIYISAHGNDTCGSSGLYIRNDIGSSCSHTFTLFDENGNSAQYPSEQIFNFIRQLEDKGALPTIVFNSCHSGRLKNKVKQTGLKHTCSYFQTAGNEIGYGCFEDDPNFSKDFTSTGEYVSLKYYQTILNQLAKDPYFANQGCFNKIKQHYEENKMSVKTVDSSYWSSRLYDETFQSPSTNDLLNFNYFTNGILFPPLSKNKPLSCSQANIAVDDLFQQLNNLQSISLSLAKEPLKSAIGKYNKAISKLKAAIKNKKPTDTILSLQEEVKELECGRLTGVDLVKA